MLLSDSVIQVVACAERIAAGWGQNYHHAALTAAISDLYNDQIAFPALWPAHRRNLSPADGGANAVRFVWMGANPFAIRPRVP